MVTDRELKNQGEWVYGFVDPTTTFITIPTLTTTDSRVTQEEFNRRCIVIGTLHPMTSRSHYRSSGGPQGHWFA